MAIWFTNTRGDASKPLDLAITYRSATNEDWYKVLDIIENADTLLKIDCISFDKLK